MVLALEKGTSVPGLSERDAAMLDYAKILTATPWKIEKSILDDLKGLGFSDKAILQINMIIGYFNFVNRLASGLGVELEDYWKVKQD